MTREDAKVFLDNLKICINEHPIVADWLVEIADRKTEPNNSKVSENPTDSTSSKMEQVDKDINVRSKAEPSGYKMKPVEQTEPQQVTGKLADTVIPTDIERGVWDYKGKGKWAKVEPQSGYCNECKWYGDKQVCGRCRSRNLYAPKTEPQTDCAWR